MAEEIDWGFVGAVLTAEPPVSIGVAFAIAPDTAVTSWQVDSVAHEIRVRFLRARREAAAVPFQHRHEAFALLNLQEAADTRFPGWQESVENGSSFTALRWAPDGPRPVTGAVEGASRSDLYLRIEEETPIPQAELIGSPVVVGGRVAGVVAKGAPDGRAWQAVAAPQIVGVLSDLGIPTRRLGEAALSAVTYAAGMETWSGEALLAGLTMHAQARSRIDFSRLLLQAGGEPGHPGRQFTGEVRDHDFEGLIGRAYELARRASGQNVISVRHLVAALLLDAVELLESKGYDVIQLRRRFVQLVAEHVPVDDVAVWASEMTQPMPARSRVRAGFRPDDLGDEDRLFVTEDVNMLCDVLAARDASPPLSVGLFGDWGTGKSFFMRQMERRIETLGQRAREAAEAGKDSAYCGNVVQIRFNAWSYLDANLWANLAVGIFERLASPPVARASDAQFDAERERQEQERIAAERRQLLEKLDTFQDLRAEVARDRDLAESQRREVDEQLQELADERRDEVAALADVRARDVVAELAANEDLRELRQRAAEKLGLSEVNVRELRDLSTDMSRLGGQASAVGRLLMKDPAKRKRVLITGAVIAVLVLVGWGVVTAAAKYWWAGTASLVASVAAAATGFARWVRPLIDTASDGLDALSQAVAKADEVESKAQEESVRQEVVLSERLKSIEARESMLLQQAADLDGKVAETVQALEELEQGRRLYRFLEERSASSEYRQHLGIVALIRRDFERLTQLLRYDNPARGSLPSIDRIIIYIDDLDRCPPPRVVEVLQAVHLLLAFPIFVVVVGVDSRWLVRSLEAHYEDMLGGNEPSLGEWESSPHDYLDKIFQIPFALAPMEPTGFATLVHSLVTVDGGSQMEAASAGTPSASGAAPPTGDASRFSRSLLHGSISEGTAEWSAGRSKAASTEIDVNPPSLAMTQPELAFMSGLAVAIGTPRSAKRFVNIYRLLRASLSTQELAGYLARREYETVLVLLAVLVGSPAKAAELFAQLAGGKSPVGGPGWLERYAAELKPQAAVIERWVPRLARFSFRTLR